MVTSKFITLPVSGWTWKNCLLAIDTTLHSLPCIRKVQIRNTSKTLHSTFSPNLILYSTKPPDIKRNGCGTESESETHCLKLSLRNMPFFISDLET